MYGNEWRMAEKAEKESDSLRKAIDFLTKGWLARVHSQRGKEKKNTLKELKYTVKEER